jgi:hypothetical protein
MATKKIAKTRTLNCPWCKKKKKMYLVDVSTFFGTKTYECTCWKRKTIK